ncbi:glutathione ABC transporter substrate-binding protein [Bartonella apis]|uniref:glutathione ABC transporter substrate-binding protein n=1 Tax=Bartonella apis TaxID=1686310 RepID=UPI003998C2DC
MLNLKRLLAAGLISTTMLMPAFAEAKTLTVAVPVNLTKLDPTNINDTLTMTSLRTIYEGLLGFDKDLKIVPLLAERYEASEDAKEFTFYLRKGVKFHDGTDFNARAVKINLERLANPENKLSRRVLVSMLDHVEVVDDYTVKVILKEPYGAFPSSMAHTGTMMISPAAIEKYGRDIDRHPVGTGPFMFKNRSSDTFEVIKNDHYWNGTVGVDGVTIRSVPENGARFAMLQAQEVQFVPDFPPELFAVAQKMPNLVVTKEPSISEYYVAINTMKKPFDDVRVRQAMNYAVDKNAFCKVVMNGFCEPATSPIPPLLKYYTNVGEYKYNIEKAKQLLTEAGYPNGFNTEIFGKNSTMVIRGLQFLQQQLAAVNIKVNVTPLEAGVEADRVWGARTPEESTVQMQFGGWSASTADADYGMRPLFSSESFPPNLFNVAYYKNAEVDKDLSDAVKTADDTKRAELYGKAQKIIFQDAPWIFLGQKDVLSGKTKNLEGVYALPDGGFLLKDAKFAD